MREHLREIEGVLGLYGIKPNFETTNGTHVRVRWTVGNREQRMVTASTPSDHRAWKNEVAKVRRLLRQAGVTKIAPLADSAPPPPPESPPIAAEPVPLDQRVAQLERDLRTVMDLLTDPERKQRMLAPAPPVEPPPRPYARDTQRRKRRTLPLQHWIFRAMRYDEFLPARAIAKAADKPYQTTAVALSLFKKRGLVEHCGKGWRKHRDVELLMKGETEH
jgi:hypothetical protein